MVKLWHDIPMGRFFMLIQLGWLAFFQYSLLMKQNNKYSISAPARIGNTITKKAPCPR